MTQNPSQARSVPSMAEKVEMIDRLCAEARILPVITIEREEDILPWPMPGRRRPARPGNHPALRARPHRHPPAA